MPRQGVTTKASSGEGTTSKGWLAQAVAWATGDEDALQAAKARRIDLFDDLRLEDRLHTLQGEEGKDCEIACLTKSVACHERCLECDRKVSSKATCRGMDENTKSWPWLIVNLVIIVLSIAQEIVLALGGNFLDRDTNREYVLAICLASLIALDEVKLLVAFHVERGDAPPHKRGCCGKWAPMNEEQRRSWMCRQRWVKRGFSLFALSIPIVQSAFVCVVAWQVEAFPWWIAYTTLSLQFAAEVFEIVLTHCIDAQVREREREKERERERERGVCVGGVLFAFAHHRPRSLSFPCLSRISKRRRA